MSNLVKLKQLKWVSSFCIIFCHHLKPLNVLKYFLNFVSVWFLCLRTMFVCISIFSFSNEIGKFLVLCAKIISRLGTGITHTHTAEEDLCVRLFFKVEMWKSPYHFPEHMQFRDITIFSWNERPVIVSIIRRKKNTGSSSLLWTAQRFALV